MIVTELELTDFRAFETAQFSFKSGVNLIAGVNGAGKSTVLDAIRILLSRASREILKSREATIDVGVRDIRRGAAFTNLSIEFGMSVGTALTRYKYYGQINREKFVAGNNSGDVRDNGTALETKFDFVTPKPRFHAPGGQPLAIYFSPHRSLLTHETTRSAPKNLAFAQALGERRFNLRQIAEWWIAQEEFALERREIESYLNALTTAIQNFAPHFVKVQPGKFDGVPDLAIWKPDLLCTRFDRFTGNDLSDGERGILAIVLEIARRLALAYPELANPIEQGSACVLIDEIELHLHPQWQRDVLGWLTRTFPRCQFIATTHSPQVIGEFEPNRIWYVQPGERPWQQARSLGLDSSRVIEELMGGLSRNAETTEKLNRVANLIDGDRLDAAREALRPLAIQLGENDPDFIRASSLIDFLEAPVDPD